jgi:OOP family OmpA-OmpF porin
VIYGHQFSPHMLIEGNLQFSIFETGVDGGTDFYQTALMGDFVWQFRDRRRGVLTPYLLAGVGGLRDDFYPNNRDGYGAIADAGAGVVTMPLTGNGLRVRLDARYVRDFREGGHSEPRVILGVDVPLGRTEHRVEVREQTVEVTRTVQAPPVVRQLPAPPPPPPPRPKPDADGDGVEDALDRCPNTLRGMTVDVQGCALSGQVFALAGVNFGFNDAQLTASDQVVLDKVSAAFVGQPALHAEIAGHTDSVGSPKANQLLSQKRADAVRGYLLKQGVQSGQVTARGYGKSQLLVDPEREPADAERNRRVELRVLTH